MKWTRLAMLLCVVLGTSAGAGAPADAREVVFADVLADAEAAGASAAQLTTLRTAVQTRTITVESARDAARRVVTCMQGAGLTARYEEQELAHGLLLPGYVVDHEVGEDVDPRITACDEREHFFVSLAYQVQPSSVAAARRYVEQRAPAIRACLEAHGYPTDPGATGDELATQASQAMRDTGSVTCLADAGIDAW